MGPLQAVMPDLAERVLHHLSFGVVVFDLRLRVIFRNEAVDLLLPEEVCIAAALEAHAIESRYQDWHAELKVVLDNKNERLFENISLRTPSGEQRLLNLFCTPLSREASGDVIGGVLVLEDVTWREGMEKRLAVSERLAAVGKLAARVAHELNNPLDGILRYINLASRIVDQGDVAKTQEYLGEARNGLLRMVHILRELLGFSRNTIGGPTGGSVNQIVEEAIRAMPDRDDEQQIRIICDFQEPMPKVAGSNLFQVFCNLIKNAQDAMVNGGTLTCKTRCEGDEVVIEFVDTGPGLGEDAGLVFEPFYTTKKQGKGTGLGLPISKDIVEKYHGTLCAENGSEGGACFTVRIPVQAGVVSRNLGQRGFAQTTEKQVDDLEGPRG